MVEKEFADAVDLVRRRADQKTLTLRESLQTSHEAVQRLVRA